MQVGDLKDFKFAVSIDTEDGWFDRGWRTTTNAKAGFLVVAGVREKEGLVADLPAQSGFYRVGAEKYVYRRDCFLGIRGVPFR